VDQIRYYNFVNYCIIKCIFTGLVVLVCQSKFCPGLWIKSCGFVNYCTIRAIVKIKMVLKVVFGTFRPIVNRIAQVGLGPNCFQALGSSPGLLQSPML